MRVLGVIGNNQASSRVSECTESPFLLRVRVVMEKVPGFMAVIANPFRKRPSTIACAHKTDGHLDGKIEFGDVRDLISKV